MLNRAQFDEIEGGFETRVEEQTRRTISLQRPEWLSGDRRPVAAFRRRRQLSDDSGGGGRWVVDLEGLDARNPMAPTVFPTTSPFGQNLVRKS